MLTGVLSACSPAGNEGFMRRVETDFRHKQELLPRGDLFGIFDEPMTRQEREAMMFLYAYMPVGDMTDYPGDFYLENVRSALATRREMPWGDIVSDESVLAFRAARAGEQREPRRFAPGVPRPAGAARRRVADVRRHPRSEPLVSRKGQLPAVGCADQFAAGHRAHGPRPLRRGVDAARRCAALGGHPGPAGLHAPLGAHRRQPRLGRGLGRPDGGISSGPASRNRCSTWGGSTPRPAAGC